MDSVDKWVMELQRMLRNYCVPVALWPRVPVAVPEWELQGATGFVLNLGRSTFLVTAAHVVTELSKALGAGSEIRVRDRTIPISAGRLHVDESHDVATLILTAEDVAYLERLDQWVICPHIWPPPSVQPGDMILFGGFPSAQRELRSPSIVQFNVHTHIARVLSTQYDQFCCHIDPESYRKLSLESGQRVQFVPGDIPGLSGGPAFVVPQVESGESIIAHHLCGLVKEGKTVGDDHLLFFSTLDGVEPDGSLAFPPAPIVRPIGPAWGA